MFPFFFFFRRRPLFLIFPGRGKFSGFLGSAPSHLVVSKLFPFCYPEVFSFGRASGSLPPRGLILGFPRTAAPFRLPASFNGFLHRGRLLVRVALDFAPPQGGDDRFPSSHRPFFFRNGFFCHGTAVGSFFGWVGCSEHKTFCVRSSPPSCLAPHLPSIAISPFCHPPFPHGGFSEGFFFFFWALTFFYLQAHPFEEFLDRWLRRNLPCVNVSYSGVFPPPANYALVFLEVPWGASYTSSSVSRQWVPCSVPSVPLVRCFVLCGGTLPCVLFPERFIPFLLLLVDPRFFFSVTIFFCRILSPNGRSFFPFPPSVDQTTLTTGLCFLAGSTP